MSSFLGDFCHPDRLAARRTLPPAPYSFLRRIAGLRITPLHHKARNGPVKTLSIIEAAPDEVHDVLDGLRRFGRIGDK
jgi:hypothetical protein